MHVSLTQGLPSLTKTLFGRQIFCVATTWIHKHRLTQNTELANKPYTIGKNMIRYTYTLVFSWGHVPFTNQEEVACMINTGLSCCPFLYTVYDRRLLTSYMRTCTVLYMFFTVLCEVDCLTHLYVYVTRKVWFSKNHDHSSFCLYTMFETFFILSIPVPVKFYYYYYAIRRSQLSPKAVTLIKGNLS